MADRKLTPQILIQQLADFQTALYLKDNSVDKIKELGLTEQQIDTIDFYLRGMTDAFGVSLLHAMGISVADGSELVESLHLQLPEEIRAVLFASLEESLDAAYETASQPH